MNTSSLNALLPLLDKLGEQVENALLTPDGISLLEKDLMKETLRRFYDTVNDLPVVNKVNEPAMTNTANIPVSTSEPSVAASVMATMKAQTIAVGTVPPVAEPAAIVSAPVEHAVSTLVADEPSKVIAQTIINIPAPAPVPAKPVVTEAAPAITVPVVEPTMEVALQQVKEEIPPVQIVQPEAPVVMSKPAVEDKVVETRSKHLHAAAMFEEQATVAAKYTAAETLSDKVTRESTTRRLSDQLKAAPLADLKTSIGINERFAFINELFSGDQQSYLQSIERINHLQAYEEARALIHGDLMQQYNWKPQSERFLQFDELVKRRFNA